MSKKRVDGWEINTDITEYVVHDTFDLTKEVDEDGTTVMREGLLTATEFLARYNADHVAKRTDAYPPIEDYLDAFVKDDAVAMAAYKDACLAVKALYPKA